MNLESDALRTFMVDRHIAGITLEQVMRLQQATLRAIEQYTARGKEVRYLRTVFVPSESHCMCLFESATAKLVQEVNEAADIPFTRIIEVIESSP